MAKSTAISITKFDRTESKRCRLEVQILVEQTEVPGIVDGTDVAPANSTELKSWKKHHGIEGSTILLTTDRSFHQQYGVQKEAMELWDQLKKDYTSKLKLNVWALRNEMSAVKLRNCENIQQYTSKIQRNVNDFNCWANTDSSTCSVTMPKSEHTYYLMKGVLKKDDWRLFPQLMYDKKEILAD
jgi:hypothetical protein